MEFEKHLSEPWFSLIKLGLKKCEGRLKKGDFSNMKKGDFIKFENNDFNFKRTFVVKITSIHYYSSFNEYLEKEGLNKCLPGIDSIEDGVKIYHKYYPIEEEEKYNIVAIRFLLTKW